MALRARIMSHSRRTTPGSQISEKNIIQQTSANGTKCLASEARLPAPVSSPWDRIHTELAIYPSDAWEEPTVRGSSLRVHLLVCNRLSTVLSVQPE